MSLSGVSDRFLAVRAAAGDEPAFAELALRYRPLIRRLTQGPPRGVEVDDLRQEALLGLLDACQFFDPAKGAFAVLASLNVRWRVNGARMAARAAKHRALNEAIHDRDDGGPGLEERLRAPAGADPVRMVLLRDELRERAERSRKQDRRRRYSDEQIERALALIAEGRTPKEAAFAVRASSHCIFRWLKRADQSRPGGRRRFTPGEIDEAVALVRAGASLREAGAAVGASKATVVRWVRTAA